MFSRIFSSSQNGSSGVGLGLNICKHIIRQFGGDINISSEPGQGSKVKFTFKVHNALFKDDSLDEEEIRKQERLAKIERDKEQKRIQDK
jgi:K+-sensing histidine kinase KdpD